MTDIPKRNTRSQLIEDPRQAGLPFAEMQVAFDEADYTGLLRQEEQEIAQDHASYFAQARAANGQPWPDLSPVTVAKKGHATILVDKGDLRRSLIDPAGPNHVGEVFERGLSFGTADPKAPYHQRGTSRMPARPPVGLTPERVTDIAEGVADTVVELLRG